MAENLLEMTLRNYVRDFKFKRNITHLFVHCSATQPEATVSSIQNYWKTHLGWKSPGYHIILPPKELVILADLNTVCNGVKGYNSNAVHISYIGGIDKVGKTKDTRTKIQARLIEIFMEETKKRFPKIKILGHNEVCNKACPSFSVKKEYPQHWTGK